MALAVVFDVGYTLLDEDRAWKETAARLGCPDSIFFALLGAVIERRGHHRDVFRLLGHDRPEPVPFAPQDLYEDAVPCLRAMKDSGLVVGIAGNFSVELESLLARETDVDFIASSERWGVEKPNHEFFARIVSEAGCPPGEIQYVGDRVDNDVVPATSAGMAAHFLVRGPWAFVQKDWPEAQLATSRSDDLASLVPA